MDDSRSVVWGTWPRLLVNLASARAGGGVTYAVSQLEALLAIWDPGRVTVLTAPWNHTAIASGTPVHCERVNVPNVALRFLWEQVVLPWRARAYDVLYCPANFSPLLCPIPVVLTQQSHYFVAEGRHHPGNRTIGSRFRTAVSTVCMRRADRVIAISRSLADAMRRDSVLEPVLPKLSVIPSGAPTWPGPPRVPACGLPPQPYVLFVGNDNEHKRLDDAVAGWAAATTSTYLVIVGRVKDESARALKAMAGRRIADLRLLGEVRDRQVLRSLYDHAAVTATVADLEALPLVPLEAMSVGCPLVASDIPPHRETAGGYAVFVPVGDIAAIASAIDRAVHAGRRGDASPWTTTWDANAAALVELLLEAAASKRYE